MSEVENLEKKPTDKERLDAFLEKHKDRISNWQKVWPNIKLPIYKDEKTGGYFWANRKLRRQ